jgi:hypothetical protein
MPEIIRELLQLHKFLFHFFLLVWWYKLFCIIRYRSNDKCKCLLRAAITAEKQRNKNSLELDNRKQVLFHHDNVRPHSV